MCFAQPEIALAAATYDRSRRGRVQIVSLAAANAAGSMSPRIIDASSHDNAVLREI
jgi:hypothetical protein